MMLRAYITIWPRIRSAIFYKADKALGYKKASNVMAWMERCMDRLANERGLNMPNPGMQNPGG